MLRSMYSGISGMRGFQTKLDVVANNIANVNTFGFKKGRATFQDIMSQTVAGAQAPQEDGAGNVVLGGKNPMQIGLGVATGSIDNIHTQGNRQTTNRPLDLAIQGDGMFVVAEDSNQDGAIVLNQDNISFTRAGNFYLDDDGHIVNPNGLFLVGNAPDAADVDTGVDDVTDLSGSTGKIKIPADAQSFSISSDGVVNFVDANGQLKIAGQIMLAKFSNPGGLEKAGNNLFKLTANSGVYAEDGAGNFTGNIADFDALADLMIPGQNGAGNIYAGALEMSNVDLAEEFTEMITAQRGFQANTRIITTSDEILQELVNLKR
ncbi:flagellar hook protein FlgE [Melghiribacillus thermohalophilus]|uniref:Flagellar hook protein FlgE n=1 Tax=Melghiribacillus thermohalophilus TaxID=1324956 RepID=A0A4R3NCX5_9BACI|nr:flagellar hook-basal body complex protein [Melghiribacillus thermohalophilus]TCT26766.1 flagellar hook protein FlgE [Melghiribacillus thermohalophilus]